MELGCECESRLLQYAVRWQLDEQLLLSGERQDARSWELYRVKTQDMKVSGEKAYSCCGSHSFSLSRTLVVLTLSMCGRNGVRDLDVLATHFVLEAPV